MPLEGVDVSRPELTERCEPRIDLAKRFGPEPIEPPLRVDGAFDHTGLAQHAQVLRHRRLRHTQLALELSDRLF